MPYDTDGLVGKLALQQGRISSAQLKDCLAEQAVLQKAGQKRPLGVIMVARGLMRDEDLLDLLEEQRRYLAERANYTQVRKEDFLFGQILLKQGVAGSDEINQALRAQAEAAERGEMPVPRLGQILMDMGVSDEKTIQKTLQIQYKTLYECPGCTLRYNLVNAESGKQYRCKKCGALLAPKPPGTGVKADESAYGLKLEVAEDLPPEVLEAEKDPSNRFDKYVLLHEIGRGGMGTVYRAYQKDLKRTVAMKLLRSGDEETRERFIREAQTAGRLKHPGIVSVYEIGRWNNVPYLTMEYIDGLPLDESGKLPVKRACQLLRDVALAVDFAHGKGVIHRDLKPENILLDRDGRAYVTDFGLAREVSAGGKNLTLEGVVVGTPAYMSPEQAQGARDLDGRSDVAALGAVLYETLTGVQPFTGATPIDVALAVIHKDPVPLRRLSPEVPPDLEAICLKAMEKERERRYPTARAFAEDLQRFQEGEAVQAKPRSVVRVTFRRIKRNKLLTGFGVAAVLAVATALGVISSSLSQSRAKDEVLRARDLEAQGRLEEALAAFSNLPGAAFDADRIRTLLRAREAAALLETARADARRALAEAGTDPLRRIDAATRVLGSLPDFEEALTVRALARQEEGEDAAAYEDYGLAARVSRAPLPHYLARAEIARRLGRAEDELADLTAALELTPGSAEVFLYRAWAQVRLARSSFPPADAEAGRRIARSLINAEADLARVKTHPLLETVRAALREIDDLARAETGDPRRRISAGFVDQAVRLYFADKPASALPAAERAVVLDPDFALGYVARGLALCEQGRWVEARADASRALEREPDLVEALGVRGLARVRQALNVLKTAPSGELRPDGAWVLDFVEGSADLQESAQHARRNPEFRALAPVGQAARNGVPAKPLADGTPARTFLSGRLVERASKLREKPDLPCAIGLLQQAVALDSRNATAYLERAECRFLSREYGDAAGDWERAASIDASLRPRLDDRIRDARRRSGG
jgi:serine/threonine protein kinase